MSVLFTYLHKLLARQLALLVMMVAVLLLANPILPYAAGMKAGGAESAGDQVTDPVNVRNDSRVVSPMSKVLEGDEIKDQLRLQDGSCEIDCDGEPDQDRIQLGR